MNKHSPFKFLPCLRCAKLSVAVLIPIRFEWLELADLTCKRCATPHVLMAKVADGMWWAVYDRDTRRYPSDHYDDNDFPIIKFKKVSFANEDDDSPYPNRGPVLVCRRRRLTPAEVRKIWLASNHRCHICNKPWKLMQRGRKGWHVDHVIPNSGGGRETEMLDNFGVACARCNLRKGRGYTNRSIKEAIQNLFTDVSDL